MRDLNFVTTNPHKLLLAQEVCPQFDINIVHHDLELLEIQAEAGEEIAKYKAHQAFQKLGKPLVITDDSWLIPGLNGFPGPYMKYMNQWLSVDDFIHLTASLTDRRIILRQIIVYQDKRQQKIFSIDIKGLLLDKPRGQGYVKHFAITSFDGGAHTAAELNDQGKSGVANQRSAWHDLCEWLLDHPAAESNPGQ